MASSYLENTLATLALIHGLVDAVSVHGDKNGDSQPEREGWKNLLKIKIDKKQYMNDLIKGTLFMNGYEIYFYLGTVNSWIENYFK